jgi:cytochrome b6-f complex iron-sulfur subunit
MLEFNRMELIPVESNKALKPSLAAMTRRVFLNVLSKGIWGGLIVYLLYPIVHFLIPPKKSSRDLDVVQLNAAEVEAGKAKIISYQDTPTIVINTSQGVLALSAVCTHLGCIVQWDESNQENVCPCHGAKYDLNGNVKSGPAPKPLVMVKARMIDNKIYIGEA